MSQYGKWEPIETAPKDGTPILTVRDGEEDSFEINEWFEFWRDVYDEQENGLFTKRRELSMSGWSKNAHRATHWMPLPPPPSTEGE